MLPRVSTSTSSVELCSLSAGTGPCASWRRWKKPADLLRSVCILDLEDPESGREVRQLDPDPPVSRRPDCVEAGWCYGVRTSAAVAEARVGYAGRWHRDGSHSPGIWFDKA